MDKSMEWALLIGRFVLGSIMTGHGLAKVFSLTRVLETFEQLGIPPLATLGMIGIEVIGGIALLLGIGVRLASFFLSTVMLGAVLFDWSLGLLAGYEFPLALFGLSLFYTLVPCQLGILKLPFPYETYRIFKRLFSKKSTRGTLQNLNERRRSS